MLAAATIAQTIIAKNDLLQRAVMAHDGSTIRKLITPDYVLITSSGHVVDGDALVTEVDDRSIEWLENASEGMHVRAYNGDTAVLTAVLHQHLIYKGKTIDARVRITDTWVKIGGDWRYVSGHASSYDGKR